MVSLRNFEGERSHPQKVSLDSQAVGSKNGEVGGEENTSEGDFRGIGEEVSAIATTGFEPAMSVTFDRRD